ncbi:MAG: biotin/lipoyl-binding protein [Candidatus Actinomarinales bacterium]|nr:MAG: biotin/lipoyl-binding protein [Candidatus Actinomarinales bacterium]
MKNKRILIANRGEIALRIIRSAKELGLTTVAVYSDIDKESLHVKKADESIHLGPSLPAESYRNLKRLVQAAVDSKSDLVHPGYGFLAENADFAKAIQRKKITWIGPSPKTIRSMGDKIESRKLVSKIGLQPIPGQLKPARNRRDAMRDAREQGFPVALKAAHGGGGKGLRIVHNPDELLENYDIVKRESEAYFGSDDIYVEKFIKNAKHVETQILSDQHGNHVFLGERDCSTQRRNQKLIEESPAYWISDEGREELKDQTLKIAEESKYINAGTVEFLADEEENFYFLEMNTRLQVEHTVTEMRYGIDIVKEQIKIAMGHSLADKEWTPRGHSIEFRINAEDASKNFIPVPGTITEYREPIGNGVRVDGWARSGTHISHFYDNLIAKLVVWGNNRKEAIEVGQRCLNEYVVLGIPTTIDALLQIISSDAFSEGKVHVKFVEENLDLFINNELKEEIETSKSETVKISLDDTPSENLPPKMPKRIGIDLSKDDSPGTIVAEMQGTIVDIMTKEGKKVKKGESLFVIEAMKMENIVSSPIDGIVKELSITKGSPVSKGDIILIIEKR